MSCHCAPYGASKVAYSSQHFPDLPFVLEPNANAALGDLQAPQADPPSLGIDMSGYDAIFDDIAYPSDVHSLAGYDRFQSIDVYAGAPQFSCRHACQLAPVTPAGDV